MPVELNRHTETILCAAVEISDPGQRAAYLDHACGDDAVLRREVERMVDDHFRAGLFLERPGSALPATYLQPLTERPGTHIGRYMLLEQIGEGGMGVVYVAEQTEPVRRRVALKIIKPGMDTRQVIARFEAERQALAMMDHPNIARVHDGGATDTGRPYFVMELVRGMPITDYCDQARLNPRGRLELFMTVCHAVQHAHQKGIIHRDIKPTNVLVTMQDGQPVVKVIDFGVAKAVNQSLTERTVYTAFTELIGTPLYMSPEQAELTSLDVDTRSDVYSLGVLLYELLTGQTPFDRDTLVKAGLDEIRRMICEDEPPRPSHRISTLKADAGSTVGQRRGFDQRQLTRVLHGELDWIVMKALEKDRNRRYESASAFAADIERHLNNEPVAAGPPSALYRFRKFARRRRGALVAISVVAISLLAGVGLSLWQAAEAYQERQRAQANYEIARQAVDDMYVQIAEKWLADEPQLEPLQRDFLLKAAEFYQKFAQEEGDNPQARFDVAVAYRRCAEIHDKMGEWDKGKASYDEAIRRLEAILQMTPGAAKCRAELAKSYLGAAIMNNYVNKPQMLTDGLKALELWRGLHREFPQELEYRRSLITTASTMGHELFYSQKSEDQWRKLDVEAEKLARELVGVDPSAKAYLILGNVLGSRGETETSRAWRGSGTGQESERFCREAVEILEKSIELDPRSAAIRYSLGGTHGGWADALRLVGRSDEARTASQRAVEILQPLCDDFPKCLRYRKALGTVYNNWAVSAQHDGQPLDEIRTYLQRAIENYSQAWMPKEYVNNFLLQSRLRLMEVLAKQHDEAEMNRQLSAYRKELAEILHQSRRLPDAGSVSPYPVYRLATMPDITNVEMVHVLDLTARRWGGSLDDKLGIALPIVDRWESDPMLNLICRVIGARSNPEALTALSLESLDKNGKKVVLTSVAWLACLMSDADHPTEAIALAQFALSRSEALFGRSKSLASGATSVEPALAVAIASIGFLFQELRMPGEALRAYEVSQSISPPEFLGWAQAGICYAFYTDEPFYDRQKGKGILAHALTITPDRIVWNYPLAVLHYRDGEFAASLDCFEAVMNHHRKHYKPDGLGSNEREGSAWDFFYVSMNHAQLGHSQEAKRWFDRGVAWMQKFDPKRQPEANEDRFPSQDFMEQHTPGYTDLRALHREAAELLQKGTESGGD